MKIINSEDITNAVKKLFLQACIAPQKDVEAALEHAFDAETSPYGKEILRQIIENNKIAKKCSMPSCQDTGMAIIFAEIGQDVHIEGNFEAAVNEGVRLAYSEGYFRKSVLSPIERINTKDNTPAIIHTRLTDGDKIKLTAAPKGFGSENMSAIKMLKPSDGVEGIIDFAVETAIKAGGSPCPPVVLGMGIGGTFEYAAIMAKRELLRPLGQPSSIPMLAKIENEIKTRINALGMGPMGLGGKTYCLAVHAAQFPTHLAGMPVAINYCCHALRHAECIL